MKWNNMTSQNLLVGQKLKVPKGSSAEGSSAKTGTAAKSKTEAASKPKSGNSKTTSYVVQSGDNLWGIADKFDVTVSQLKSANNLKSNSRLMPGQKLRIPK